MRALITIIALAFASSALAADKCQLILTMKYAGIGNQIGVVTITTSYNEIDKVAAADVFKMSQAVIDVASKEQDKGGDDAITFGGSNTCGLQMGELVTNNMKRQGASKVLHKSMDVGNDIIKKYDK